MLIVSLTLVQDVAHSLCNEAETQMRIADRRIFLKKKKKNQSKTKSGPAPLHLNTRCHTAQRAARCFYSEKIGEHKWELITCLERSRFFSVQVWREEQSDTGLLLSDKQMW